MTVLHKPKPLTATPTDWVVEDIPAGTFRVNRAALADEAVFRDEMRSIFDRCWLYVGHESEIPKPGDFRARDVGNRPLVFWHGHDGVKRVFYNTCRHRGALVCRVPEGNTRTMNCFYHAWTYGSTGALNGLPGEEGYGPTFDRASMSLLSPAKVDSYRGFVFACFDPGAVDLRTYLAGAADYLDLVADQAEAMEIVPGAHEYSADANWKLYRGEQHRRLPRAAAAHHLLRVSGAGRGQPADPRRSQRGLRPRQRARGGQVSRAVGAAGGPLDARPRRAATANASRPPTPSWSANTGRSGPS